MIGSHSRTCLFSAFPIEPHITIPVGSATADIRSDARLLSADSVSQKVASLLRGIRSRPFSYRISTNIGIRFSTELSCGPCQISLPHCVANSGYPSHRGIETLTASATKDFGSSADDDQCPVKKLAVGINEHIFYNERSQLILARNQFRNSTLELL
jgi:hypothetical protein